MMSQFIEFIYTINKVWCDSKTPVSIFDHELYLQYRFYPTFLEIGRRELLNKLAHIVAVGCRRLRIRVQCDGMTWIGFYQSKM